MTETIACFQFASSNLHLISSIKVTEQISKNLQNLNYYWWGSQTMYPSIMSKHLDSFVSSPIPKSLKNILELSNFQNTFIESRKRLRTEDFIQAKRELILQLRECKDLDSLFEIEFNNIMPGPAISNALAFETNEMIDLVCKHMKLLEKLLISYLEIYFSAFSIITNNDFAYVVIYNGRFLHERAVWDACKALNQRTVLFETIRNRYHFRINEGFHSHQINQNMMISHWDESPLSKQEKCEIGSKYFFDLRSTRNDFHLHSPTNSVIKQPYIAFFTNSDDEFVGFRENGKPLDQITTILEIANYLHLSTRFKFVVRIHPNLKRKSAAEQNRWKTIAEHPNIILFNQFSPQSSYELMLASSGVVTFGSTIGLEASFWEIPSVVVGETPFGRLGALDAVTDFVGLTKWFNLLPLSREEILRRREAACIRGFWLETAGNEIIDAQLIETSWGAWDVTEFRNKTLSRSKISHTSHKIQNLLKRKLNGYYRK